MPMGERLRLCRYCGRDAGNEKGENWGARGGLHPERDRHVKYVACVAVQHVVVDGSKGIHGLGTADRPHDKWVPGGLRMNAYL